VYPKHSQDLEELRALRATGGAPLLLGVGAELHGNTVFADVCRSVMERGIGGIDLEDAHPHINDQHPDAGTALHWAVAQRLREASLALIASRHFDLVNAARSSDGSTAFHLAAAEGLADVVEALLRHPEFDGVGAADKDGFTALHGAAYCGRSSCVELLVEHFRFRPCIGAIGRFDVRRPPGHWATEAAADYDMTTALHMAAARGHAEICHLILSQGPGDIAAADATNRIGATALHMAARAGHTAVCRAILRHVEFTAVNARDLKGQTALHWAAQQASGEACGLLLAREDFHAVEAKDLRGRTAMDVAKERGFHEVRRLILQRLGPEALRDA